MKMLWQQIPNPIISEIFSVVGKENGFNGIVFDTEHGVFSDDVLFNCISITQKNNSLAFVRVTYLEKKLVRLILDSGADGVIFSTVETVEQSKEIKNYCYYPPSGIRGQGLVRENFWGERPFNRRKPFLVAQIETVKGLSNLSLIRNECDFDIYMIGPYDLSASLGCLGNFDDEAYKKAIDKFNLLVPSEKRGYHIVKNIEKQIDLYKDSSFIALSIDTLFLINGIKELSKILEKS